MQPGDVVAGRFEVQAVAGAGGMGVVLRARDRTSGLPVALKILRGTDDEHRGRFEREADILAQLDHPSIVRYVDRGPLDEGLYLAMEWLVGEDLAAHLTRRRPSVEETLALGRRVADALAAAHARGIVHRDIKPSNVFLRARALDGATLLDFGVARLGDLARSTTRTGVAIGTPGYMAPEQVRGERNLDARADVFSLGCVLFQCLTGEPPFVAEHVLGLLAKVLLDDAPHVQELVADVPDTLDDLVARMLAKDPAERPADGAAVLAELARIDSAERPAARPRTLAPPTELSLGEQRFLCIILAGAPRRRVVDVAAQTPVPEPVDDTPVTLVDEPHALLHAAVELAGGRLERLGQDSWVATIGAVRRDASGIGVATDQALRAARCALAMRGVLPDAPLALTTGRTVLVSRLPVGEAIDRAARLVRAGTGLAARDTSPVRIDDVTAGLLASRFDIAGDERGLVLGEEREQASPERLLLGRSTPFVGRDRELGFLRATFFECIAERVARGVLVSGPAGSGKSRLRHELLREIARLGGVEAWICRADPLRVASPFGVLAPLLRSLAGIRDGEPPELRRHKLRARVERQLAGENAARVTAFLGELAGVSFVDAGDELGAAVALQLRSASDDPILMGDQMLRAWVDFVAAELAVQPLVIVLEDLQWGDLPSLRLAGAALRRSAELPLLVLALARPDAKHAPSFVAEHGLTELRLEPLPRRAATSLVQAVLGTGTAPEAVARIVERAEGNTFYLEELVRAFAEGRGAEAPETVLAMVQARLERLEPDARRVLRAASVFGQTFWQGGVEALTGTSSSRSAADWLSGLDRRELVERRPSCRFPGEIEHRFRHAMVRDAAYASLTEEDRTLGHRLAARWLETAGEDDAVVLATHHERAGDAAGAARWLRRAAEQALEGHDFATAIERANAARRSLEGEERGALLVLEAEAHRWTGDFARAEALAGEAALALPIGSRLWFRALEETMSSWARQGRYERALGTAERAGGVVAEEDARSAQITALCSAARMLFHAGLYEDADRVAAQVGALAASAATVDPRAVAEVHRLGGARARHRGDLAGDVGGYEAALRAFVAAGDVRNGCNTRVSLGFAYVEVGDYTRAEHELEEALRAAQELGLHPVATRARQNLGLVRLEQGRVEEARELELAAIAASAAHGNVRFEGWTRIYLALVSLAAADPIGAEREARAAAALLAVTPPALAGARAALALALLGSGRTEEALAEARAADEVLREFGGIEEFESLVHLAWCESLRAVGDEPAYRAAVERAHDRVHARADAIGDAQLRESFLQRVPENARLLAMARAPDIL